MKNYGRRTFNNNKILRKWRINVSWGVTLTVGHNGVFFAFAAKNTQNNVLECANTREIPYKKIVRLHLNGGTIHRLTEDFSVAEQTR